MGGIARSALAAGFLALAGCMAAYQPDGMGGGYTDEKLDEDTYLVSFRGNGYTPEGAVLKYFLYRCAELTLAQGYAYFELYAPPSRPSVDAMWRYRAIVRMYPKEILFRTRTLFSASEVMADLGAEVRSGNPSAAVPEKYRIVRGKFPVMQVRREEDLPSPAPPAAGGPVNLDDLEGLMKR